MHTFYILWCMSERSDSSILWWYPRRGTSPRDGFNREQGGQLQPPEVDIMKIIPMAKRLRKFGRKGAPFLEGDPIHTLWYESLGLLISIAYSFVSTGHKYVCRGMHPLGTSSVVEIKKLTKCFNFVPEVSSISENLPLSIKAFHPALQGCDMNQGLWIRGGVP